jgi:hypothetical protein
MCIRAFIFAGLVAFGTDNAQARSPCEAPQVQASQRLAVGGIGSPPDATQRPAIGGIGSPPDAMIFYVAHGATGACGPNCADWIAAEGTVQFDTHKRLINILDRNAGRKLPLVIHSRSQSNLSVATSLGRIVRDRGLDTTVGATGVDACDGKTAADCFALKRPGGPLEAKLDRPGPYCDLACVLILAGGVHRDLPASTRVIMSSIIVENRIAPNISEQERKGATARYGELFRIYLRDMGVETELLDIMDRNPDSCRPIELAPAEWSRLHITAP